MENRVLPRSTIGVSSLRSTFECVCVVAPRFARRSSFDFFCISEHRRLVVGMRMTAMNGETLTGYTYNEVLEKLSRIPRPVRIRFADISKGIVVCWFIRRNDRAARLIS